VLKIMVGDVMVELEREPKTKKIFFGVLERVGFECSSSTKQHYKDNVLANGVAVSLVERRGRSKLFYLSQLDLVIGKVLSLNLAKEIVGLKQ